jgi:hypothetical protein
LGARCADEVRGTLASLVAYVGTLALLGILGVHLRDQLPDAAAIEPAAKTVSSLASRSSPAFALRDKTEGYEIFGHPSGNPAAIPGRVRGRLSLENVAVAPPSQDAGFHATFSLRPALLWSGVAQLT